jgi:hypothetical protein
MPHNGAYGKSAGLRLRPWMMREGSSPYGRDRAFSRGHGEAAVAAIGPLRGEITTAR